MYSQRFNWADQWNTPKENILFIFEDGDQDKGNLSDSAKHDFGFRPGFDKKSASVGFEAADLLAYEHLQVMPRIFEDPNTLLGNGDIRKSLRALRLIPHQTKNGEDTWVIFERPHIESGFRMVLEHERRSQL